MYPTQLTEVNVQPVTSISGENCLKPKFKARPAAQRYNRPLEPNCLGPVSVAASPEASLLAAVIRQAVDDYAFTEGAVAHIQSRKHARRWMRLRSAAREFLFEDFDDFLDWYDVKHVFHAETILRGVRRIYGEAQ